LLQRGLRLSGSATRIEGEEALIVGTTGAAAVRAGYEALLQGGSAVDAALTTSLAQIALAGGSWVSYAGLFSMVVYDAETGEVHALNACFGIPRGEDDPMSIPAQGTGTPSGRSALVPGFMAGVGAAHERYGKLTFDSLFGPAIHFAEQGFPMPAHLAGMIEGRRAVLERLPETRRVFFGEDGAALPVGELFRQPELAATLRAVATEGVGHMYTGPWAQRLVEIVQREGGKITLEDLAAYEPIWSEPVRTDYRGFEVAANGFPSHGGVNTVEALNVLEEAGLGTPTASPESLFWWIQTTNLFALSFLTPQKMWFLVPGREVTRETRVTREWASWVWERMQEGKLSLTRAPEGGTHSDAVVAVDRWGNAVAIVHSINTVTWGETGIFVAGVSIPDAACYQQEALAMAGPGARLPDPTSPLLVLRDGRPLLVSSSIGGGLHQETIQCLGWVLDGGRTPWDAIDQPSFLLPAFSALGRSTCQVPEGEFDAELLAAVRALGQPIDEVGREIQGGARGYWIGIHIDPQTGALQGASPSGLGGGGFGR